MSLTLGRKIMLSDAELEQLFANLSLPNSTRTIVRRIRSESPVREPQARLGNVNVWFFSPKMGGIHLKLESRTVEAVVAAYYEHENSVLEYWPQPIDVDLTLSDSNGTPLTRSRYTPDFLVIRNSEIVITEWREESRLNSLSRKSRQFFKDESNIWHYRAAEERFSALGLKYELHSSLEIPRKLIDNVRFLLDYHDPRRPQLSDQICDQLRLIFESKGTIPFLDLLNEHEFSADDIFSAAVANVIYADLMYSRLDLPSDLMLHRDALHARTFRLLNNNSKVPVLPYPGMARIEPGSTVKYNGEQFRVLLVSSNEALLQDCGGNKFSLPIRDIETLWGRAADIEIDSLRPTESRSRNLSDFSSRQLAVAVDRLECLDNGCNKVSQRTIARWRKETSSSLTRIDALIALMDRSPEKGNRNRRLPDETENLAAQVIRQFHSTPTCRTAIAAYAKYRVLCDEKTVAPMSYPTFCKRVNALTSIKQREGKRKEYQLDRIPLYLDYRHPIHGARPHDVCYIDHTILSIALAGPNGSDLGKPTFTHAVDGHTTQSRAFYLSFEPPSSRAVLMTLRDYVRRNFRLPKVLVVDGGKEFRSNELKLFCRIFQIDIRHRPSGRPRFGSPVERSIGYTETELISQLEGNTQLMKNARMVTKSVNPFQFRKWTLTALWGALNQFLYEIRDTREHSTLGMPPRAYEEMRLRETGSRNHVLVRYDANLLLMTSPHPTNHTHTIDRVRGVWADNIYYWHENFRSAKRHEKVEVRFEPWDANVIYAYFREQWIAAIARDLTQYAGRTRYEVQLALRAERRRAKTNATKARISLANSKKMASLWSPEAFDSRIHEQQQEMRYLYKQIGMDCALSMRNSSRQKRESGGLSNREIGADQVERILKNTPCSPKNGISDKSGTMDSDFTDSSFWKDKHDYL